MKRSRAIGVVWPGTPGPEDIEEVGRFVPAGVEMHMVGVKHRPEPSEGITLERVAALAADSNIEEAAKELVPLGVGAVGYGCTSASYVRGVGGDVDISSRIAAATGLPATTTSSAVVLALRDRGVTQVAVLSPHVDRLNDRLRRFLEDSGFHVVKMRGLNKLGDIEDIPPETIYELVVDEVDCPEANGVFISCTGMRTAVVIDAMEEAIGKPVVTANQATVWELLRLAGVPAKTRAPARV